MTFRCVSCDKKLDINIKNGRVKKGAPITIICAGCKCENRIVRKKNGKIILVKKKRADYSI